MHKVREDDPDSGARSDGDACTSAGRAAIPTTQREDRRDIQVLRGVAVLLVLMHHAKMPFLHGGYLGVDIFFVISGYLITALIIREVDSGSFSFARFYWRRAWRLLPALYVMILVCVVLSTILLRSIEMSDFTKQVAGAVTFTGNIALWLQTGYFEQAAEHKPLLHVWSLSIEEQYYLLIPAVLVFLPKRARLPVMFFATVASLGLCFFLIGTKPGATFYLLPTRAWEMGIGTVAALWASRLPPVTQRLQLIALLAISVILILAARPISRIHPGVDALICCLGTAALLLTPATWLNQGRIANAVAFVGDRSYSLYLVHWPIFAFLNGTNLGPGELPWAIRLAAALGALALAWALHKWVEVPCRPLGHKKISKVRFIWLIAASFSLICAAWLVQQSTATGAGFDQRLRSNHGLADVCAQEGQYVRLDACQTASIPRVVVWGDSFSMHLMAGLTALPVSGLVQASRDTCAALLGVALYAPAKFSESWAKSCIEFNNGVLNALAKDFAAAQIVVISSPYLYLLTGQVFTATDGVVESTAEVVASALIKTIAAVRATGKRVVLVGPPPSTGFDMGLCNERLETGKFSFGANAGCDVALDAYRARYAAVWKMLADVKVRANVEVISFDDVLCDVQANRCVTRLEGNIMYRDKGHFSLEGSRWVAKKMQLVEQIDRLAK